MINSAGANFPRCILHLAFCLLPMAGAAQSLFDSVRVARTAEVYFATGSSELDSAAHAVLDTLCRFFLRNRRAEAIRIAAHTDSLGSTEHNLALSRQRADAVREALQQRGIATQKIQIACFGERRPATANATEDGRQRNRRATIEVLVRIPMTDFSGQVTDQETGQGIPATVVFSFKTWSDSMRTDTGGHYAVRLPQDIPVKVDAFAEGHFFESVLRHTYGSKALITRTLAETGDIRLQPARPGEVTVLKELFFRGGLAILLEGSKPQLPKILKFMQLNPGLRIEIAGHINMPYWTEGARNLPKTDIDWQLSENRAKLVYDYLLDHGIAAGRLRYRGYGNTQMVKPMARSEADQELNRRVEIRVLEKE